MKKIKNVLLFLLLGICSVTAQETAMKKPILSLEPTASNERMPDSIIVIFRKNNISKTYDSKRITIKPKKGVYHVDLPALDHIAMIDLVFYYGTEIIRLEGHYFVAPSDKVKILFQKKQGAILLDFSGKGADKYTIAYQMIAENSNLWTNLNNSYFKFGKKIMASTFCDSKNLDTIINEWNDMSETSMLHHESILSKDGQNIDTELKNFCRAEFDSSRSMLLTILWRLYCSTTTQECKIRIGNFYLSKIPSVNLVSKNTLIKYSYNFISYKGRELSNELDIRNGSKKHSFKQQYDALKAIGLTDVRDRLIADMFMNPEVRTGINNFTQRDSCLKDALKIVNLSFLLTPLNKQLLFTEGSEIYNFSFADTSGNLISLNDLKGKVFLIDFYGEGCGGCAAFYKQFKDNVFPEFSEDPRFAVVSVSVDRTKDRWLKAMNSGLYTDKHHINLNTGSLGVKHPMLWNYYKITAIPFLLLVNSDGKLIAKIDNQSNEQISAMIRRALNNKILN
ncbi:Peroxiredoxin [Pedobacter sp. ok626]|uniref:TlpA family protein disulfide reductase n=1 Tax=Pedobacter sp. ok626 TaxID=1761882 RepID=UPI000888CE57|nr:TlpA disulfide reductase family protein [Pedobacter sp. ok626]SDK10646.1 Peroxiredoxin [Pedobacter sp. ok626]